ncbi:MAG: cytochrome c family protein [Betaproteobacteria bacterium]
MNYTESFHCAGVRAVVALAMGVWAVSVAGQQFRLDPTQVKGPEACGECHEKNLFAWRETHHSKTFKDLPRSDKAREIADKLGIKRVKNDSECVSCHFTSGVAKGETEPQAIAGISCESCHAAGLGYIDVHSDYGGKDVKAKDETPAHRKARWEKAEARGIIRPGNLYALAQNCYQCHTVPNEKLVNVGGHAAGSDFELVAWSQGEVRHNLWYTDGKQNKEATPERRRLMYVVGQALDLEYALRGVDKATAKDNYAVAMAQRAKKAALGIKKIADAGVKLPEVAEILKVAGAAEVKLSNEKPLLAAADAIAAQSKLIASKYNGSELAALDGLLPAPGSYKGKVYVP